MISNIFISDDTTTSFELFIKIDVIECSVILGKQH